MKNDNRLLKVVFYFVAASVTGYMFYLGYFSDVVYTRGNEISKAESTEGYYVKLGLWALAALFFVYLALEELFKYFLKKLDKNDD